ncbi:hypothetical protein, partial [Mesorhizobium sp. M7A.F.Ca.US.002.01.1.1]|uniref:hypothetical protein n=1 Tax=Mesorhizobium sp. M7A.F.Ca.US.002.01.1.1 TaxID=2496700 RepID=UPI0019D4CD7B
SLHSEGTHHGDSNDTPTKDFGQHRTRVAHRLGAVRGAAQRSIQRWTVRRIRNADFYQVEM